MWSLGKVVMVNLKWVLRVNAGFTSFCVVCITLMSGHLPIYFGGLQQGWFLLLAAGLVPFVGLILWVSERHPLSLPMLKSIIVMDILWVLGTSLLVLIFYSSISSAGITLVFLINIVVSVCAFFQYKGLMQLLAQMKMN